jgi:hypothetical protein
MTPGSKQATYSSANGGAAGRIAAAINYVDAIDLT